MFVELFYTLKYLNYEKLSYLILSLGIFSCSEDLEEVYEVDRIEQTTFVYGVGDVTADVVVYSDGSVKLDKEFDSQVKGNFEREFENVSMLVDQNDKLYIFPSNALKESYIRTNFKSNERCSENTNGSVDFKFYKHKNYGHHYAQLNRSVGSSGFFGIPNIAGQYGTPNDEISSFKVDNDRYRLMYRLDLYDDIYYGGSSLTIFIHQCQPTRYRSDLKYSTIFYNAWFGFFVTEAAFNDKISSIQGSYVS